LEHSSQNVKYKSIHPYRNQNKPYKTYQSSW
jgi:hypothetical protein